MKLIVSEPRLTQREQHIELLLNSVIDRLIFHRIGDERFRDEALQELREKGEYLVNESGILVISGEADEDYECSGACISPVPLGVEVVGGNYVGLKAVCVIVGDSEEDLFAMEQKLKNVL